MGKQLAGILGGALVIGGLSGAMSTQGGREAIVGASRTAAAVMDGRSRQPQAGDFWAGCDDARAAGSAPIFRGEPGYREGMDGDGDGIACEPYH